MKQTMPLVRRISLACVGLFALITVAPQPVSADPSKYPQLAQQSLPANVTPSFISINELVQEIRAGKKPLIVDVRTAQEFREAHILGAISVPVTEFNEYVHSMPKDRLVVLY